MISRRRLGDIISRTGIIAIIGATIITCAVAGVYTQSVVNQLRDTQVQLDNRQIRNGYVAISDIHRLVVIAQRAVSQGEMSAELQTEFMNAADILYVRKDHLFATAERTDFLEEAQPSIDAIGDIVSIADQAIGAGFGDLEDVLENLLAESEVARAALVRFQDELRRDADDIALQQGYVIGRQQAAVMTTLILVTVVSVVSLALLRREVLGRRARAFAEKRAQYLAYHDALTGLPNRTHFYDKVNKTLAQGRKPLSVLSIDVDGFKSINDTYGHAGGDAALRHVGKILSDIASERGLISARLAGDEFAVSILDERAEVLLALCEQITTKVGQPFNMDGNSISLKISIGAAAASSVQSSDRPTLDELFRVTDFALYSVKGDQVKSYALYDDRLKAQYFERRILLDELPDALENDALTVFLQPKVSLPDRSVYGFEALVRWRRDGSLIPPGQFINIAEEAGLILELDRFVLRSATQKVANWNRIHGTDFTLSVNLSALHFGTDRIVRWVEEALWQSELPASSLSLEITETIEMRDWQKAQNTVQELREMGCKISIDDFGTGYSSLAYLRTLTAHELKVDRALLMEVDTSTRAHTLLKSVLDIGHRLRFDVLVEGVETQAQCDILQDMGCQLAQGFLFGRPDEAETALAQATNPPALAAQPA